jgi:ethanolamine permease
MPLNGEPPNRATPAAFSWREVAALGIAIAISGNLSGWNYGLDAGGWGGMLVAALAMALLFLGLALSIAELSAAIPEAAGGFDGYVERAFGPTAAYLVGISVSCALSIGSGLAVSFGEAYVAGGLHVGGWPVKVALVAGVALLQLRGSREAVGLTSFIGLTTLLILVAFCLYMAPLWAPDQLFTTGAQGRTLFPRGVTGILGCIPFALFLFLGVEQAAQAGAEMHDVRGEMPRALATAIGVVFLIGIAVLIIATGSAGVASIAHSDAPLYAAVTAHPSRAGASVMAYVVGAGAPIALAGTFFSLAYAGSRQILHLAQAGRPHSVLATLNSNQAPIGAIAILSLIALVTAAFAPDTVMTLFIFLLNISYVLLLGSFISLRVREPALIRPYRALGGPWLAGISIVLSFAVMVSCYRLQPQLITAGIAVLGLLTLYVARSAAARVRLA